MLRANSIDLTRTISSVVLIAGAVLFCGTLFLAETSTAAEHAHDLPAAQSDVPRADKIQMAVFAGGCFWGVQGVFQHVTGVVSATAGYAGGAANTAKYDWVESGKTGHAEAVVFEPRVITYSDLLRIFFSVAHDPTQFDRQGADVGSQYRSAIFSVDENQKRVASAYIKQLDQSSVLASKITTTIEEDKPFYQAERYHQNYLVGHPTEPYVLFTEQPKIDNLKKFYPSVYREKPVMVETQS